MTAAEPGLQDACTAPHFGTSAVMVIDVQRDVLSEAPSGAVPGTMEILPVLRRTVSAFCVAGRPVVHVVRLYEEGGGNRSGAAASAGVGGADRRSGYGGQ